MTPLGLPRRPILSLLLKRGCANDWRVGPDGKSGSVRMNRFESYHPHICSFERFRKCGIMIFFQTMSGSKRGRDRKPKTGWAFQKSAIVLYGYSVQYAAWLDVVFYTLWDEGSNPSRNLIVAITQWQSSKSWILCPFSKEVITSVKMIDPKVVLGLSG